MNTSSVLTNDYENKPLRRRGENKPNQTQFPPNPDDFNPQFSPAAACAFGAKITKLALVILPFPLLADVSICGAATSIGSGLPARIPRLLWYIPRCVAVYGPEADLSGDCIVYLEDLQVMAEEWLLPVLSADVASYGGDGVVDFLDWGSFADAWQSTSSLPNWNPECDIAPAGGDGAVDVNDLGVFVEEWLQTGARYADIGPGEGDGAVNLLDFAALADNWLEEKFWPSEP